MVSTVHDAVRRFAQFQKEKGTPRDVQTFGFHLIIEAVLDEVYGEKVEE